MQLFQDILNRIGSGVNRFVGGLSDGFRNLIPPTKIRFASPTPTPTVAPSPTPPPNDLAELTERIKTGMTNWGRGTAPPIATLSGELARAGNELPDKYLPAVLSLKESAGEGNNQGAINNWFNNPPGRVFPTPESSIYGTEGDNFMSLKETLRPGGLYQKYLDSGDLADFFRVYSPPGRDNASLNEQLRIYNDIRNRYFSE